MSVVLKVREKGIVIIPKRLRERAGIKEGSTVIATVVDGGIIISPKETDVARKLLGLAKVSGGVSRYSTKRVRMIRADIDKQERLARKED